MSWLLIIDGLLLLFALLLAGLALGGLDRALDLADSRKRVVYFVAFGLVLALLWARLGAPDVALAEAAIGSGFAGALLLAALKDPLPKPERESSEVCVLTNLLVTLLSGVLALLVGWAIWQAFAEVDADRLAPVVFAAMPATGVENPVTGVLLNLRAYDTLLELAVLLAAALAIGSLGAARQPDRSPEPVLSGLLPWLIGALILGAGYLLWVGANAPGGAFQAGALLAGAGVVLHLTGRGQAGLPGLTWQPWLLISGVAIFLGVGLAMFAVGGALLEYRDEQAGLLILLIEIFATLSIGGLLAAAYLAGAPRPLPDGERSVDPHPTLSQGEGPR